MPNNNSVGADLSAVTADLTTVEGILDKSISLENISSGHIRVTSTNAAFETVLTTAGTGFVGGQLLTSSLSGATAEMRMFDNSVADANKISHAKATANESIMCGASPANFQDGLIVQLKSDGANTVEGLVWIIEAEAATNPVLETDLDTYLDEGTPGGNFSTQNVMVVGMDVSNNVDTVALIKFDLSTLPFGREIESAILTIDARTSSADPDDVCAIHAVLVEWIADEATWNNRTTGDTWDTAGMGSGTDYRAAIETTLGTTDGLKSVDITSLTQEWVNQTLPNNGITIRPSPASGGSWGALTQALYSQSDFVGEPPPTLTITFKT